MPIKAGPSPEKKTATDKKIPKKRTLKSVAKSVTPSQRKSNAEELKKKFPVKVAAKKKSKLKKLKKDGTPRVKNKGADNKITELVLRDLELCFMIGMNDREACIFCDIGESTLYDYQRDNPDFSEKKKLWKNKITLQAKINIGRSIKSGDDINSKWWLERKARKEFGARVGLIDETDEIKTQEITSDEDKEMYARILHTNLK